MQRLTCGTSGHAQKMLVAHEADILGMSNLLDALDKVPTEKYSKRL